MKLFEVAISWSTKVKVVNVAKETKKKLPWISKVSDR